MTGLREEKKLKVRNAILEVSRDAFMTDGYEKTSTKAIAKKAGIGAGTLFNYFPTKADILVEIITTTMAQDMDHEKIKVLKDESANDIIYNFLYKYIKPLMTIPPKLSKEFAIATLSLLRNQENIARKLIDIDLNLLANLEELTEELKNKGLIDKNNDSKRLANIIFNCLCFDIAFYIFDGRSTKDEIYQNIKNNVAYLLR